MNKIPMASRKEPTKRPKPVERNGIRIYDLTACEAFEWRVRARSTCEACVRGVCVARACEASV